MPTYDYLCGKCGHQFEKFQSITAGNLKKCPECGKMSLHRLIGAGSGIIFKGSGFYETDYRSENYNSGKSNAKAKTDTKKSDKKETKKADKKSSPKKSETKSSKKK
jgi:putative FmdB family regulatory protein